MLTFGEWLPDRRTLDNVGVSNATNVVPVVNGYAPFQAGVVVTDALDNRCQGAASFKQTDGSSYVYAGDEEKLYMLNNGVWDDAQAKPYSTTEFNQWKFLQFGSLVLAVNGSDKIQKIRSGAATAFEEIESSPVSSFIAAVKDFIVVGSIVIGSDRFIQWSARNNVDEWTPLVGSSGLQALNEGGQLMGITGGDFGIILQESAVTRMSFVGGDLVFTFDVIEGSRGCFVSGSVIRLGAVTYYWSEEGVEAFTGTGGVNIGEGKVNTTLFERLDFDNVHLVTATIDPIRRLVIWAYPVNGVVSRLLVYNVGQNKFSDIEMTVQVLLSTRDETVSIDDIAGSIDDSPLTGYPTVTSLDDPLLLGGTRRLAAFNTSNQMMTLDGDNLAATITLGERIFTNNGQTIINDNKNIRIARLRGAVDGDYTLSSIHRLKMQDTATTSAFDAPEEDGSVVGRVNDRYQALQMNIASGVSWDLAQGIDIEEAVKGGR